MLSETITEGLDTYAIGEKLRRLRLKKKIGLVELGQHSGLSPAMISKIECGKLYPTLPTLLRLALVFSVGLDHFFTDTKPCPVKALVRKADRQSFPDRPDTTDIAYYFESLDFPATERRMSSYLARFEPWREGMSAVSRHEHDGVEFIYVITGALQLHLEDEVHELSAGDAIYFDASVAHGYARLGKVKCTGLVVTIP